MDGGGDRNQEGESTGGLPKDHIHPRKGSINGRHSQTDPLTPTRSGAAARIFQQQWEGGGGGGAAGECGEVDLL